MNIELIANATAIAIFNIIEPIIFIEKKDDASGKIIIEVMDINICNLIALHNPKFVHWKDVIAWWADNKTISKNTELTKKDVV